jgi:asparagine synthase (glutamine-hydrolysing)
MCGINGFILENSKTVEPDVIEKMNEALIHRGPDDEGVYHQGNVTLGMRRLSIIDLASGKQPIYNEDRSIVTVFNGEIYNYRELKVELEKRGHRFSTNSDTEVIVHQYEEDGEDCVQHFRGMFAFAIWDEKKKRMVLARDRLGIKQIYFYHKNGEFVFSSEIKGILAYPGVDRVIDVNALSDYFSFLYVPCPKTIFKDIIQIPPAHVLIHEKGDIRLRRYWNIRYQVDSQYREDEYIEKFLNLLRESIRLRLISDVPLGAFLSGGVDSGLIVSLMSKMLDIPVETFSIGYRQGMETFDERKYARAVSERYQTNHHEFIVQPDIRSVTEKIITYFDQPFADASAIPNYYLSQKTREFVTVALSGLGGDEMAGGYERYLGFMLGEYYQKIPSLFREEVILPILNRMSDSKKGKHFIGRLKKFARVGGLPAAERYYRLVTRFDDEEKKRLFSSDLIHSTDHHESMDVFTNLLKSQNNLDPLNQLLYVDLNTYLVDDLLVLTDRMSMAHSLEVRVPFLDHKLVEFFATIPVHLKIKGWDKKYILKKAAERYLSKENIYRRKTGFSVPLVLWFRTDLKDYVSDVLSESTIRRSGFFNYECVFKIINDHFNRSANNDEKIWALIVFVLWHQKYFND